MKRTIQWIFIIFFLGFTGCQKPIDPARETQKVQDILQNYFNAVADRNWEELKAVSTNDMILLENGLEWNNDSLIQSIEKYWQGFDLRFTLDFVSTHIDRNSAWIYYRNSATGVKDTIQAEIKWLESACFVKQNEEWKIKLLHSTLIPE
ncbi:MAG: nuclear transport factor 2 family protein [Bacteroidales bacterium]|jgi:hypothetical protein|nr:nuclear transport factor 2 family protein [Bacteroidales bacterium]